MSASPHEPRPLFRSLLAGFAAVLVVALGLLAQAPAAHAWLHSTIVGCETADSGHGHAAPAGAKSVASPEHVCAITIFAQGADHVAPSITVAPFAAIFSGEQTSEAAPRLARVAHLLPPAQAPPTVG